MKRLPFLVLLSSVVLVWCADPALETITCTNDSVAAAARLAIHDINKNHHHGYKFQLKETEGNKVEKVGEGCNIELQLKLLETICHVVNPEHFEYCPLREEYEREVMANCNVTIAVKNEDANVTKYTCKTQQDRTSICPNCVTLLPLNDTEGLKSVNEAVKKFNENTTNKHYYILKEVGRISSRSIGTEINYNAELALVETRCPVGSRIITETCFPLCPDRAHHAFCNSSYSHTNGLGSIECEFYPPMNTTELAPGEKERMCRHPHHHHHHRHHGPPPHAHDQDQNQGPPFHGQGHGPPFHGRDHGHRTRSHDGDRGHGPPSHGGDGGDRGHGPPSHGGDRGHGPPSYGRDRGHGPPSRGRDHGHGPPSHGWDHGHGPPSHGHNHSNGSTHSHKKWHHHKFFQPCHGFLTDVDPALHPICPWPFPEHHNKPKPHQS